MELVERYLASIQAELSEAKSSEIIREMRANILDEIDAIEASNKASINDEQICKILIKFGHPVVVAQQYEPEQPLVSGSDMPLFKTILWHSSALIFVLALVTSAGNLIVAESLNPIRFLLQAIASFLDNIGLLLISVTVIFYYLGKEGYIHKWCHKQWSPQQLPKNPSVKLKLSDAITDLSTALFLLLLLWTSLWMTDEAQQELFFSLASDREYWRYILTALCLFSVGFALYRLTLQSWTKVSLSIYIIDNVLFACAFFAMAYQMDLIVFLPDQVQNIKAIEEWQWAKESIQTTFYWSLVIVGLIVSWFALYYTWLLTKLK